jgi:cold shock CspA family protein
VVVEFDAEIGLGAIEADDGTRWPFHCTVIADGSRTIPVGARVRFDRRSGGPGHWEAYSVEP